MTARERARRQVQQDEGLRLKPYMDTTGHLTIGYGRNLTDNGISEYEALLLLDHDLNTAIDGLHDALPWVEDLDEARWAVLVNMTFNLGLPKLLKFQRTLKLVKAEDYTKAASAMLESLWAKQVGQRAVRLARQMASGTWQ